MLAVLALALLRLRQLPPRELHPSHSMHILTMLLALETFTSPPKPPVSVDYFSRRERSRGLSPGWPPLSPTPASPTSPPSGTPGRGSWSSLFHSTLHARHAREVSAPVNQTHTAAPVEGRRHGSSPSSPGGPGIPVPGRSRAHRVSDPTRVQLAKVSTSASWTQSRTPPLRTPVSFASTGHGWKRSAGAKPTPRQPVAKTIVMVKFADPDKFVRMAYPYEFSLTEHIVLRARIPSSTRRTWRNMCSTFAHMPTFYTAAKGF
jgi:hypothetical protein